MQSPERRAALDTSVAAIALQIGDERRNIGTAFAVTDHFILTAAHVCDVKRYGDLWLNVRGGQRVYAVRIQQAEDLCLLYAPRHGMEPLEVGSKPSKGDHVWVFGGPMGFEGVLTEGYLGREVYVALGPYSGTRNQISAPSYGGNSGGPVLDDRGNVIGMLVAGHPNYPNVSYSVPIEDIENILRIVK